MTKYVCSVDWPAIHEAARQLDHARTSSQITIGTEGFIDAFCGQYRPHQYEQHGLSGLVDLANALRAIRKHAWHVAHQAGRDKPRGARKLVQQAVLTALVSQALADLLVAAGVMRQGEDICTVQKGHLLIQGLAWLTGSPFDTGRVPLGIAQAFADSGQLKILHDHFGNEQKGTATC